MLGYFLVAAIVFAINLLPAFGPPTSAVLVALTLSFDLAPLGGEPRAQSASCRCQNKASRCSGDRPWGGPEDQWTSQAERR
jgi:hypothetical protein